MIELCKGDLLSSGAMALVNTINCVGVMGRGLALQFKTQFPTMFESYKLACSQGRVKTGSVWVYQYEPEKYIINFPTKEHWKNPSKIEYIQDGLIALVEFVRTHNITSIAIPPLGCGLGGLDWEVVYPMIQDAFKDLNDVQVMIYPPKGV